MDKAILDDPLLYIPKFFKVLTKAQEGGISQLVPMKLLPVQEYYIKNRTSRDIILKARQQGMSTGIMAANSHLYFTKRFMKGSVVAHNQDTAEFLFQTIKRFYRNLPQQLRPAANLNSMARINFPEMDTFIHINSAESKAIGFGETLNVVHLSEVSRWPEHSAKELFAGISQTVPHQGLITVESTPRGRGGLFYDLYQGAKKGDNHYKAFFFPWWWELDYKRPVPEKVQFSNDENELMKQYKLSPEQIMFRREKIAEIGDLFYQEYPENDVDCWLSSEISVFDASAIRRYMQGVWMGKVEGNWTIWKDVIGGEKYVIGVDVAGGSAKGDWSVASVLNVKRNEYVARVRGKYPPDAFAQDVLRLAKKYNDAEVGVEKTGHGHMVLSIMLEVGYPNIYYHEDYDQVSREYMTRVPGWKTSVRSKPIMIDDLSAALRANDIAIWSENFFDEAANYVWKPGATKEIAQHISGTNDDELDAVMIALQIRESVPIYETTRYKTQSYVKI